MRRSFPDTQQLVAPDPPTRRTAHRRAPETKAGIWNRLADEFSGIGIRLARDGALRLGRRCRSYGCKLSLEPTAYSDIRVPVRG